MKAWLMAVGAAIVVAGVHGCTDAKGAKKTLQAAGYTDVQTGGLSDFVCADDDLFATGFNAKDPGGLPVSGAVCRGLIKGSTVRLNP